MTLVIKIGNESKPGGPGTVYHNIAECAGIVVRKSKGSAIRELARKLQESGVSREALVIVQRDGMTVFPERPLHQWADYMLYEPDDGPMRLVRWNYEAAAKLKKQREMEAAE